MTKRQKRLTVVGSAFAAAALALALVLTALNDAVAYFYTPSDLATIAAPAGIIRLGGLVEPGSVAWGADKAVVRFVVADEFARTPVSFAGILPDLFRAGQGVVVQGRLGDDGTLEASEVLAKHDENYMPREVADALKKQGRWREGAKAATP